MMRAAMITNDYGDVPVGGIGVHTEYLVQNLARDLEP